MILTISSLIIHAVLSELPCISAEIFIDAGMCNFWTIFVKSQKDLTKTFQDLFDVKFQVVIYTKILRYSHHGPTRADIGIILETSV